MRSRNVARASVLPVPVLALVLALAPITATAQGQLDAGISRSDYDSQVAAATGWRVSGAYRVHELVALELGYVDLGEGDVRGTSARYRVKGVTVGVRGYWPLSASLDAVGHLGAYEYESSLNVLGTRDQSEGSGVYFGVGAEWTPAPPFFVGGEWRRYQVHDIDPSVFTLYVGARF